MAVFEVIQQTLADSNRSGTVFPRSLAMTQQTRSPLSRCLATSATIAQVLLGLMLAAGCGGRSPPLPVVGSTPSATPVEFLVTRQRDIDETVTLPGSIEAWEELTLSLEQSGPIRWIAAREGARVSRGDKLLGIDVAARLAALKRDELDLELARQRWQRSEELFARKLHSETERDNARLAYEVACAEATLAQLALDQSTLISPIDGIVDELLIDKGEYGLVGQAAAVVVRVDSLRVAVAIPEREVGFVQAGERVVVSMTPFAAQPNAVFAGQVIHVPYRADPATRTYRVEVAIEGSALLRPGMIVRVELLRRQHRDVVAVPLYALTQRADGPAVFVEVDGWARCRPVSLGPLIGDQAVILEGLHAGEHLIIRGQQLIEDGSAVLPIETLSVVPDPDPPSQTSSVTRADVGG